MPRRDPFQRVHLKSGKTRYRFVIDVGKKPNGKRDQRTFTYDTLREARTERNRMLSEVEAKTFVRPANTTVAEYIAEWLEGKRNVRPKTLRTYSDALLPVVERLGQVKLQDLTKAQLDKLVTWMLKQGRRKPNGDHKGLSPNTVTRCLQVLTNALNDAERAGRVGRNVAALVERPTGLAPELGTWTAEDGVSFLKYVRDDPAYVAWLLAMYGLRRGEVLGLRWSDVDFEAQTITVRWTRSTTDGVDVVEGPPKTRKGIRTLPMDEALQKALWRLRIVSEPCIPCGICSGFHVVVNAYGDPRRPAWMTERFRDLVTRYRLPLIRLHDVRHTCGTLMHLQGVPAAVISQWLGHANAAFTMKQYVHSQNPALVAARSALVSNHV